MTADIKKEQKLSELATELQMTPLSKKKISFYNRRNENTMAQFAKERGSEMEKLVGFLDMNSIWLMLCGLLILLLLQTMTLHKIRGAARLLQKMEADRKCGSEAEDKKECGLSTECDMQLSQSGESEIVKDGQTVEETPEELIDAVLAEVFR